MGHARLWAIGAVVAALLAAGCGGDGGAAGAPSGPSAPAARTSRGWPGPDNTGVPAGTRLSPVVGQLTFSTPGQVVDAKDVTGCITVTASNVTLSRFRVRGCAREPVISVGYGLSGIRIEDCEIDGGNLNPDASAVGYDGYTMRRCDVHNTGSGLHMTNDVTVEDSWVHDLQEGDDSHNDSVITNGGAGLVVRHNTLENSHTQTSVVALYGDLDAVVDVVVQDNLLVGGGYTVYGGSVPGKRHSAQAAGIRVTGNRFSRRFFATGGSFGPVSGFDPGRPGNLWSGNVWDDTGAAVGP
jgi:hypothetical protein